MDSRSLLSHNFVSKKLIDADLKQIGPSKQKALIIITIDFKNE
jgi:hypothetical protein